MPTRTDAAAVGQAHMELKEKWTVYKCMKSVLVPGTALFMMWTADDVKLHPSTVFQGNVRIASLQGTAAGFHVFVFKDNVGRKVRSQDMDKIVQVSNNILASRQGVHQVAKSAAINETLCDDLQGENFDASEEEGGDSDAEEGGESSDSSEDEGGENPSGAAGENPSGGIPSVTIGGIALATKTPAGVGAVVTGIEPSGEPAGVEADKETEDVASMPTTTTIVANEKEDLGRDPILNLDNPPPPPGSEFQDGSLSLPDTIRELREIEALLKDKKKMVRSMKKRALDVDDKRAQKKHLEDQLKAIKKEQKSEKAKAKLEKKMRAPKKRVRLDSDDNEAEGESDDFGLFARAERKPLNTIDKWQKGHRRAALLAVENKVVEAVTCTTWAEAYENMYEHGWAVVDHFADLLHPACRPDAEQRDYVLDCT